MAYLSMALMYCAGMTASVYLVTHDHPWFAAFILLITGCLQVNSPRKQTVDASKTES